jgi:hypothetical protein
MAENQLIRVGHQYSLPRLSLPLSATRNRSSGVIVRESCIAEFFSRKPNPLDSSAQPLLANT